MNVEGVKKYVSNLDWDGQERGAAAKLAADLGVSHAAVSKWRFGAAAPRSKYWHGIEQAFGLEQDAILKAAGIDEPMRSDELEQAIASVERLLALLDETRAQTLSAARDLRRLHL